jgi:hypothetical protein
MNNKKKQVVKKRISLNETQFSLSALSEGCNEHSAV